ncbi:MAG: ABC transporter permease [Fimbriimonadales bacterium]
MQTLRRSSLVNMLGLVIALIVLIAVFGALMPGKFATAANLEQTLRQSAAVCLGAIGMTFIIVSGGIDLSVGSSAALVTVVIAWLSVRGYDPALAALGGIVAGGLVGLINGSLITKLKVGPFIVTLGALSLIRGLAKGIGHEQKIDAPVTWLNSLLTKLSPEKAWMVAAPGVWFVLFAAIIATVLLQRTVFGRHVFAIGGNEQAARYAGLNVAKTKVWVYTLGGIFTGLAGLMLFSRLTVGDPTVAIGLELDVIAAVVIGGASLSGGQGSIWGSLLGALIMAVIRAGCSQYGLPQWVQEMVTGAIIVLAVALDRLRVKQAS